MWADAFCEKDMETNVLGVARTNMRLTLAHMPSVSVIMIFLDADKFIEEAIESVLTQSFQTWELLLIDDGSQDASTAIARRYAQAYPGQIYHLEHDGHENRGMSASRNLGLEHARGEYIAFLDADDVWFPHTLAKLIHAVQMHPELGMVIGKTLYWHSWTGDPQARDYPDWNSRRRPATDTVFQPPELLLCFLQDPGTVPCMGSLLAQRRVLQRVGGFEESFRGMYEDQVLYAKVALAAPVLAIDELLSKYRQHPNSCTSRAAQSVQTDNFRLAYLKWLTTYSAFQSSKHSKLRRTLRKELWSARYPILNGVIHLRQRARYEMNRYRKELQRYPRLANLAARLLRRRGPGAVPRVGQARFGDLRRVEPFSFNFGYERGQPVDRYYIENFLLQHSADIRGRVLEIGDNSYTARFGGAKVEKSEVLHVNADAPQATIIGDITQADHIPSNNFDCIVFTQTLHLIYDASAAVATLYRILKPGGVLLATFPGITQIDYGEWGDRWYWSFTTLSARHMFQEVFFDGNLEIEPHGNVLVAVAALQGMATHELTQSELNCNDPHYQVLITTRAVKEHAGGA